MFDFPPPNCHRMEPEARAVLLVELLNIQERLDQIMDILELLNESEDA